ncbi:MAG: septal ring lytic transglycosylase RlpA family protein [Nitrospirae bacterium]|nr:septal ring lytic transglycosylase RlpA family protein [Nitrospirota bacterium]
MNSNNLKFKIYSFHFTIFFSILLLTFSCAGPKRAGYYKEGFTERGLASWYGKDFHGRKTANGEVYDMYKLSAAHKTLPLGVYARVTNLENGKEVKVKVNDRGPFIRGRFLDLSYGAAKELGMVEAGVAKVELEILGEVPYQTAKGKTSAGRVSSAGLFTIQVGAFVEKENAVRLKSLLENRYKDVHIVSYDTNIQKFYRVRVGAFESEKDALKVADELEAQSYTIFITVRD